MPEEPPGVGGTVHICSIVARNYLPAARVLARSFLEHNPGGTVSVLVLDDVHCVVDSATEPFEVVRLEELGEHLAELHRMATIYDVMEFATSVKPWLLQMLLDRGLSSVLYLDPDIEVFDDLSELARLAEEHAIVLMPHARAPYPRDNLKTDETAILAAGVYNLGFIGVGTRSGPFLRFWMERLRRDCFVDPANMRFVDQRWVDFAPGMFDSIVLRDPRYNVAYWNLHEREVCWTGRRYEVEGRPLGFFHFSGYSPRQRHVLSKHQGERPRILLSEFPDLRRICDGYGDRLIEDGYRLEPDDGPPYAFARTLNGLPIDRVLRSLYRAELFASDQGTHDPPPDPFTADGAAAIVRWLNAPPLAPTVGPNRLTLYQASYYAYHPSLWAEYPDPQGADYDRFQDWLRAAAAEGTIDPLLVPLEAEAPAVPAPAPSPHPGGPGPTRVLAVGGEWPSVDELRPGILVTGFLRAELGIGEGARLTVAAVEDSGVPFSTLLYDVTASRQKHPFGSVGENRLDFDTNVVVINADEWPRFAHRTGPRFFEGRYTIAQWAWELEDFPAQWSPSFDVIDEIWAVSSFSRDAIAARFDKPVYAFPHPIVVPPVAAGVDRRALRLPDGFLFLFCFDAFSVHQRKNPIGLIEAFARAFEPGEGPVLVLKVINADMCVVDIEEVRIAAAGRPDIVVIDRYLTAGENAALMNAADCYVSLHRSEGFGLTMAEAMALGKPVIATAYSGNLDFMDGENSYLVPFTYGRVPAGCDPYPEGCRWADPDLDVAADLMRHVVANPDEAAAVGARARADVLERHSVAARGAFVRARFEEIERTRARVRADGGGTGPLVVRPAPAALVDTGSPGGRQAGRAGAPASRAARTSVDVDPAHVLAARALDVRRHVDTLIERVATGAPVTSPARFGAAAQWVRRLVRRVQRHGLEHQQAVDGALARSLGELALTVQALCAAVADQARVAEDHARQIDGTWELYGAVTARTNDVLSAHEEALRLQGRRMAAVDRFAGELSPFRSADGGAQGWMDALAPVITELRAVVAQLTAFPDMGERSPFETTDEQGRRAIGYRLDAIDESEFSYREFEDVFRGPERLIKERQRCYLDVLVDAAPVVDLGCGRGELLELLADEHVEAVGVDLDPNMVVRCRAKGLHVEQTDALSFLADQTDASFGAVFSAQVVEHLAYKDLLDLLHQGRRVLRPGGVFVAETVNPHSLTAFKAFWTDPTHRAPLFPEVLVALCRSAGFEEAIVRFPGGTGDLEHDRLERGDYAVIARNKPS